jgi:riboflavin synthase
MKRAALARIVFTGIVEATGEVVGIEDTAGGRRLQIATDFEDLVHGQSISVSGACLTVEDVKEDSFTVFLAQETVSRTALGGCQEGDGVNLERALPAGGRFDGHVVQGHVDATAEVVGIERLGDDWEFTVSLPASVERYVVEKGSIAVDGISLTVAERDGSKGDGDDTFSVAIIPTTYEETTLGTTEVGDPVHIEVDVIAKYVERMLEGYGPDTA